MTDPLRPVVCPLHGQAPSTRACRHVATGVACGWHSIGPEADPWPDAVCDACDEALARSGGHWTAEVVAFSRPTQVCIRCSETAKERNTRLPPLARGYEVRLNDDEVTRLLRHAASHVDGLNDTIRKQFGWHDPDVHTLDLAAGRIAFDGGFRETLVADVQLAGTRVALTGLFHWGWSALPQGHPAGRISGLMPAYGEVRGIFACVEPATIADADLAMHLASLAAYLTGAHGLYVAEQNGQALHLLLENLRYG